MEFPDGDTNLPKRLEFKRVQKMGRQKAAAVFCIVMMQKCSNS